MTADSNNYGDAEADSFFAGVLGAGTSDPSTTVDSQTMAHMDGTITGGQSLTILAQTASLGTANGTSGSGALLGSVGVNTQTTVSPLTQASIGDNFDIAAVRVSGDVDVTAQATDEATADAAAGDFGILTLGTVDATAMLTPTVKTFLGDNSSIISSSGSVALDALHNYNTNGPITMVSFGPFGHAIFLTTGAFANGSGTGGDKSVDAGVVSINSLSPTASANATVSSEVNPGATINAAANVALLAESDNSTNSMAGILNFGIIGYGGVSSSATSQGTTQAQFNAINGLLAGGNLSAIALGTDATTSQSTADGGGVLQWGASTSTADDTPTVLAALSSAHLVDVGGNTTIQGLALGNSSADAQGGGGGVIQVGTSSGEASWTPTIEANVGAGTDLKSGGDVNILAYDNLNQAGNQDTSRTATAKATASGGGVVAVDAADTVVNITSNTDAHIGAGASVSAGDDLNVNALSYNQAGGDLNAAAGGVVNQGSAKGSMYMISQTWAGTDDATGAAPTLLAAGNLIHVFSDTSDNASATVEGSGGGVIGGGGVSLYLYLDNPASGPTTQARLGNNTTVNAPGASLQVLAQNQNNFSSTVTQQTIGALQLNEGLADSLCGTAANNLQTLAEIGNNANVTVGQFLLSADDANLQADASAKTEADGGGVTDAANAEADEYTDAKAHIGSGSNITSATTLTVTANADNVATNAYSKPTVVAAGAIYSSTAGSNKFVTTEADLDPGSQLTAAYVSVVAAQPPQTGGSTYVRNADKTDVSFNPGFGCSQNTTGSEVITDFVNLNSNIMLTGGMDHNLSVDPTGKVTAESGLVVTDGANPLAIGQTDTTGRIVVSALAPSNTSTLIVSAAGGTTSGSSNVVFESNGTVIIQNASPNDLDLGALDVVETGSPPPVTDTANHPNWTYVGTTTTGGGFIDVSSSNAAGGNIHFTGPITNPLGGTVIDTSDGNLLADNPGAVIQTAAIDLEADQGTLGTPSQSLPVQLVFTPGITTAISRATGGGGVYLDVQPTSSNAGPFNLPVNNVSSANGSVTLKFEDGQAASAPTSDTITVQNVNSTQGNVTIVAGTSSTVPSERGPHGPDHQSPGDHDDNDFSRKYHPWGRGPTHSPPYRNADGQSRLRRRGGRHSHRLGSRSVRCQRPGRHQGKRYRRPAGGRQRDLVRREHRPDRRQCDGRNRRSPAQRHIER